MFIEINEQNQNVIYISTVNKEIITIDGEQTYRLKYVFANGSVLYETFDTKADMEQKYEQVLSVSSIDNFIEIDGKMMNLHWISSYQQVGSDMSYTKANGTEMEESFDTPEEAEERYEEISKESSIDINNYYTKNEVNNLVSKNLKTKFVDTLPQEGEVNTIYFVRKQGKSGDVYDEYIFDNNGNPEKIGSTDIDLTPYATKEYSDDADLDTLNAAKDYADTLFSSLVDGDEEEF